MNSCCLYNNKISIYFLFVFPLLTWNKEVPANQFVVRFYMLFFFSGEYYTIPGRKGSQFSSYEIKLQNQVKENGSTISFFELLTWS